MTTLLALLAAAGVLVVVAVAVVVVRRDDPVLTPAPRAAAALRLPDGPLGPDDVRRVRFSVALRGYRASEVDVVLERLAQQLEDRDARDTAADWRPGPLAPRVDP